MPDIMQQQDEAYRREAGLQTRIDELEGELGCIKSLVDAFYEFGRPVDPKAHLPERVQYVYDALVDAYLTDGYEGYTGAGRLREHIRTLRAACGEAEEGLRTAMGAYPPDDEIIDSARVTLARALDVTSEHAPSEAEED